RLAYAALVYAGESEAEARSGAEKLLWYMTANKVPLHFCYPPGYVPTPVHAQILRGAAVDHTPPSERTRPRTRRSRPASSLRARPSRSFDRSSKCTTASAASGIS